MKFSNNIEITVKDLILLGTLLVSLAAAFFTLPQKLEADFEARFVGKELFIETIKRMDRIEIKLDKIIDWQVRYK